MQVALRSDEVGRTKDGLGKSASVVAPAQFEFAIHVAFGVCAQPLFLEALKQNTTQIALHARVVATHYPAC